jgi:hypothetical protein
MKVARATNAGENARVPAARSQRAVDAGPGSGRAVAARISARVKELGTSESKIAIALGWSRTVLSATLRRLKAQGEEQADLETATLRKLELVLAKPMTWILTGSMPEGVRLADCPGWAEACAIARERWSLSEATLAEIGETRFSRTVRYVEPGLIRSISDAL